MNIMVVYSIFVTNNYGWHITLQLLEADVFIQNSNVDKQKGKQIASADHKATNVTNCTNMPDIGLQLTYDYVYLLKTHAPFMKNSSKATFNTLIVSLVATYIRLWGFPKVPTWIIQHLYNNMEYTLKTRHG